jgi:hypothetical protein
VENYAKLFAYMKLFVSLSGINKQKLKKMKTLEQLNQMICDFMNIKIEDYNNMTISEQKKVGQKYMKLKFNLNTRNK